MKRVLSLQDLSCFGKCSLTIALPVISAMGVECVPVPTAILSTHTGNLGDVAVIDMTDYIEPILSHLNELGILFDVIYIGYLGSIKQIGIAKKLINMFKTEHTKVLLDPVMGDNGSLYKRFNSDYVNEMKTLLPFSDYVVPNLTEAAFLSGTDYMGEKISERQLINLFEKLNKYFSQRFILTGVCNEKLEIGAVSYYNNNSIKHMIRRSAERFHGTGDLFASVIAGSLAKGYSLEKAIIKSVEFTAAVIEKTVTAGTNANYGLHFEDCLELLSD